jgi:hypothetical protein
MAPLEIRNDTDTDIQVSVCKSKFSGTIYVEIGGSHNPETVKANYYLIPNINEVDY